MFEVLGQANINFATHWVCNFFANETADAAAINKPNQMPRQPAKGEGVITVRRTNWKERCSVCQSGHHRVPIEHFFKCQWAIHRVQASLVRQQLRNRYVLFPVCSELGPNLRNRIFVRQQTALNTHGHCCCNDTLGAAEHQLQRVECVRLGCVSVEKATGNVNHALSLMKHRHACADVITVVDVVCQCVGYVRPSVGNKTVEWHD